MRRETPAHHTGHTSLGCTRYRLKCCCAARGQAQGRSNSAICQRFGASSASAPLRRPVTLSGSRQHHTGARRFLLQDCLHPAFRNLEPIRRFADIQVPTDHPKTPVQDNSPQLADDSSEPPHLRRQRRSRSHRFHRTRVDHPTVLRSVSHCRPVQARTSNNSRARRPPLLWCRTPAAKGQGVSQGALVLLPSADVTSPTSFRRKEADNSGRIRTKGQVLAWRWGRTQRVSRIVACSVWRGRRSPFPRMSGLFLGPRTALRHLWTHPWEQGKSSSRRPGELIQSGVRSGPTRGPEHEAQSAKSRLSGY